MLADLPSGETRAPFDRPLDLPSFWDAVGHCLAPDGTVVAIASSLPFAARVIGSRLDWYRYDLVWHKSIAVGFLNARRRPLRAHEHVLVFGPGPGRYEVQMAGGGAPPSTPPGASPTRRTTAGTPPSPRVARERPTATRRPC